MKFKKGIKLQFLISLLVLFTIVSTVVIDWVISMQSYRETLIEEQKAHNLSYVKKLSNITEHHLDHMLQSVTAIATLASEHEIDQENLESWFSPSRESFNSVFITDENGIIQTISPARIVFEDGAVITKGVQISEDVMKRLEKERKGFISDPYISMSGQLITLLAAPILEPETGKLKGSVVGTIHMLRDNELNNILGDHSYDELTYVYVVDRHGRLIYHPWKERVWQNVLKNEVVQKVINGESGAEFVVNTEGKEFFASYAHVDNVGWGIVSQTATSKIEEPINALFWRIVTLSIPYLIIVLFISAFIVSRITKPIKTLASYSAKMIKNKSHSASSLPTIKSSIYEVRQLYEQVSNHLRVLSRQVSRDGLTNLANRKTLEEIVGRWLEEDVPFSLLIIDIDRFKRVNDTYGHLVGDKVLKFLAKEMKKTFNQAGYSFRYGGEEFVVLLQNKTLKEAFEIAEEFREKIASTVSPCGDKITISIGVTNRKDEDTIMDTIIERADAALYYSKETGRNKTTIFERDACELKNKKVNNEEYTHRDELLS